MKTLKMLRLEKKLTQQQAAEWIGISLRSYKSYENDKEKHGSLKYQYILEKLTKFNFIDEEHGLLSLEEIRSRVSAVLDKYDVSFCYLFGSYAKGMQQPASDIDLLVSGNVKGLQFFGMVEELRKQLQKKVDVLDMSQLKDNLPLTEEILKEGIKIYG